MADRGEPADHINADSGPPAHLNGAAHPDIDPPAFNDRDAVEAFARQRMAEGCDANAVHAELKALVAGRRMRIGDQLSIDQLRRLANGKHRAKVRAANDAGEPRPMRKRASSKPEPEAKREPKAVQPTDPAGVIALPTEPTVSFSLVENTTPDGLAVKVFDLEDGKLVTKSAAQIYEGRIRRVTVEGLAGIKAFVDALEPNQAICWGVPTRDSARLVTQEELRRGVAPDAIARDHDHIRWKQGEPAVALFDYDPGQSGRPMTAQDLDAAYCQHLPGYSETARVLDPSSTFGICAPDGKQLRGDGGWHTRLIVDDGSKIPAIGEFVHQAFWEAGLGYIKVSAAGIPLDRSPTDHHVQQAERLEFCAKPILRSGLTRKVPPSLVISGRPMLPSAPLIPELTLKDWRRTSKKRAEAIKKKALEIAEARKAFVIRRGAEFAEGADPSRVKYVRSLFHRGATEQVLASEFPLKRSDGEIVTVAELLSDVDKYDGTRFHDPLEPDYPPNGRPDNRIAWADLKSEIGGPVIRSFAHGGMTYKLVGESSSIDLVKGELPRAIDESLALMRARGELFERGTPSMVVRVPDDGIQEVSDDWLADYLGRHVRYMVFNPRNNTPERVDTPPVLARRINSKKGEFGLRQLRGVITAPTMRRDGSLLVEPGYDEQTGLLLKPGRWPAIYMNPSKEQLIAALRELWRPYEKFPFVDEVSRSIMLATVICAVIRQMLPTAPGTSFDAPDAGSGKTLLGQTVLALVGTPPVATSVSSDEEEIRKAVLSVLREGKAGVLLDNIRGEFKSAAIERLLTTEWYSDRLLGASQQISLPSILMVMFSGNNFKAVGDLWRRILTARIDARSDAPERRAFNLEPLSYCREHRQSMVAAALTLLRGFLGSGARRDTPERVGSFEVWDDMVRQTVIWIGKEKLFADLKADTVAQPFFADPAVSMQRAKEENPERRLLISFLSSVKAWRTTQWSTHDAIEEANSAARASNFGTGSNVEGLALHEVLVEISSTANAKAGAINPRKVGNWLADQVGKRVPHLDANGKREGTMHLDRVGIRNGRLFWTVVHNNGRSTEADVRAEYGPGAWEDEDAAA
jgi:hypothetical protein